MNTPICDFVNEYKDKHAVRMHMPGHKGRTLLGPEALDITEIDGADVLYHAGGIIRESEDNASAIFGTARSLYSTEGSSLCIRAMLYLVSMYARTKGRTTAHIAAGRNAHKTFITAAALLDIDVKWLYSSDNEGLVSCKLSAEDIEAAISEEVPDAVYITSPDYLGNIADIGRIATICHRHGCLLIVDNAHGAYLKFMHNETALSTANVNAAENEAAAKMTKLRLSIHPIDLGADMCCDSAHKTLPVLTGGAYLHISEQAPELFKSAAEQALAMFASTSPSYLILQSLDMADKLMSEEYPKLCAAAAGRIAGLKAKLRTAGYELIGDEALKLCIASKSFGYRGTELADKLSEQNIYIEFSDPDYAVMMFTPFSTAADIDLLEQTLLNIERRKAIDEAIPQIHNGIALMSAKDALMSENELVSVDDAFGRILAEPGVSCPPAVPVAVCGEKLDEHSIACFKYYGIDKLRVVRGLS